MKNWYTFITLPSISKMWWQQQGRLCYMLPVIGSTRLAKIYFCIVKPMCCTFYSIYWGLMASTCFEHYLIIFRRCFTSGTWYIAFVLCQFAAPGLKWNYIYIYILLTLISNSMYEEYWSFHTLPLVFELLILYNVKSSPLTKLAVVLYLVLGKHSGEMSATLSAILIGFIMV
jgi:hypothetical protein